jgi:hypothetical protein
MNKGVTVQFDNSEFAKRSDAIEPNTFNSVALAAA